jgi:SAM-dependent methyltransferase
MGDWIAFWNSEHSIYVNARHREVHYRTIAQDIAQIIKAHSASKTRVNALSPSAAAILDYGCGEALSADIVAATTRRLILCEAAPMVRVALERRFAGNAKINAKIEVRTPEDVAALSPASLDIIVLHSVAQYLTADELDTLLALFRRLLANKGLLIVGDVIPPHVAAWTDAAALIRFAAANGFLTAALVGLARTVLSDYWRLRSQLGLTRYGETAMIEKLARAGFSATRAPRNIGHNQARMTFLGSPT